MTPGKNVIAGVVVTGDDCSTVLLIPGKNLSQVSLSRAKLFSSVDTSDKFIAGVIVTGDNCSVVSTTPVINLSLVSTTLPITESPSQRSIAWVVDTGDKFVYRRYR